MAAPMGVSPLALKLGCQHRDKREPNSSGSREPGFDGLIGGDAVENSKSDSIF
jgi:hypothetical protein